MASVKITRVTSRLLAPAPNDGVFPAGQVIREGHMPGDLLRRWQRLERELDELQRQLEPYWSEAMGG